MWPDGGRTGVGRGPDRGRTGVGRGADGARGGRVLPCRAMPLFRRKPVLPAEFVPAWRAFLDAAQVIESGRRVLLSTLPTGRVEPAPIGVGLDAIGAAIQDARGWMPDWQVEAVADDWQDCLAALDEADGGIATVRSVAASTSELEELLEAVSEVVAPLDAFADAERTWRRTWRILETPHPVADPVADPGVESTASDTDGGGADPDAVGH